MAIVVTTPAVKTFGWILNATSADVSGCEELKAAPSAGSIMIRHLTINSTDAISITIGEGKNGAAVTTALLGPIAFAALETMQWTFNPMLKLTAATSLTIDGDAGNVCVFVQGTVE